MTTVPCLRRGRVLHPVVHMMLHFLVPGLVAKGFFGEKWLKAWFVMLAAMLIDLDHLLADPVFDPDRCSIGFHPLHGWVAGGVYLVLAAVPVTRILGVGLLIHLGLDGVDCWWMRL